MYIIYIHAMNVRHMLHNVIHYIPVYTVHTPVYTMYILYIRRECTSYVVYNIIHYILCVYYTHVSIYNVYTIYTPQMHVICCILHPTSIHTCDIIHITRMNESCHTYEQESRHTYEQHHTMRNQFAFADNPLTKNKGGGGVGGRLAAVEVVLCLFFLYWLVLQVCVWHECVRERAGERQRETTYIHACMHIVVWCLLCCLLVCCLVLCLFSYWLVWCVRERERHSASTVCLSVCSLSHCVSTVCPSVCLCVLCLFLFPAGLSTM